MTGVLLLASTLLLQQVPAPTVALTPDTVLVGDVVNLAFRIDAPRNSQLIIPDTLNISGDVENATRARVRTDTLENGSLRFTAHYGVVGWRPGSMSLPPIEGVLRTPAGDLPFSINAPQFSIASVLPADTAGIEPKPLKDVIGPTRVWWLTALAILAALIVLALLIWLWRRRHRRQQETAVAVPGVPPRELFLRELDEIAQGPLRQGDLRIFYIRLSAAARRYLGVLDPEWGEELTTAELAPRMRRPELATVVAVLERADLVKFARRVAPQDEARRDLLELRRWAETYETPAPPPLVEAA